MNEVLRQFGLELLKGRRFAAALDDPAAKKAKTAAAGAAAAAAASGDFIDWSGLGLLGPAQVWKGFRV